MINMEICNLRCGILNYTRTSTVDIYFSLNDEEKVELIEIKKRTVKLKKIFKIT